MEWLTKDFIKEINEFLCSGNISNIKYETKIKINEDNEWENILLSTNNNDFHKNEAIRDYIRSFLIKFPDFNDDYSRNRDLSLKYFYIYNPNAKNFKDFRISNFNTLMNDNLELKWFDEYIHRFYAKFPLSSANTWRKDGNMLVKCTTTTDQNAFYMVANYCIENNGDNTMYCQGDKIAYKQYSAKYKASTVLDAFDHLYSRKLKAVRGFVRYDDDGKHDAIKFLYSTIKLKSKKFFTFAFSLMSTFIKGECMAEEAEFRFLLLTPKYKIKEIILPIMPEHIKFNYKKDELIKEINECYKNICCCGTHICI